MRSTPFWFWWGVGLLLVTPALWLGLQLDDYLHWVLLSGAVPETLQAQLSFPQPGSIAGLFGFMNGDPQRATALMEQGLLPWWIDPDVRYSFWRPLPELTHLLDYRLFNGQPVLMHVHSLAWHGALLGCGFLLLKTFQPTGRAALWGAVILVLFYGHGVPAAWLANRNALLALVFGWLTLWCYHQRVVSMQTRYLLLGMVCWVAALLSGEIAVTSGGYLVAYAIWLDRRARRRWQALLPFIGIGVVWLIVRRVLGYGAAASGHYIDPLSEPVRFALALGQRVPDLLAGVLWSMPPELAGLLPGVRWVLWLPLCGVLLYWSWPLLRRQRVTGFWLTGMALSLLPVASTVAHGRLLVPASLGMAGWLGVMLTQNWQHPALFKPQRARLAKILVPTLIVLHMPLSALLLPVSALSMKLVGDGLVNTGARHWPDADDGKVAPLQILINPPLSSITGYWLAARYYLNPTPQLIQTRYWPLASGQQSLQLTRLDDNSLLLEAETGLYDAQVENLFRSQSRPLQPGWQRSLQAGPDNNSVMTVTVTAARADTVTAARFQFSLSLADTQQIRFYLWGQGKPVACEIPPVGTTLRITAASRACAMP